MNRINHKRFHLSNPLNWSWNETFCAARIYSNIQIKTNRLKNIPYKCIEYFLHEDHRSYQAVSSWGPSAWIPRQEMLTASEDSEAELLKISQFYTWGFKKYS